MMFVEKCLNFRVGLVGTFSFQEEEVLVCAICKNVFSIIPKIIKHHLHVYGMAAKLCCAAPLHHTS